MDRPELVEVLWIDSGMSLSEGWESKAQHLERASLRQMEVLTVGMLMERNDEVVIIGLSYDPTHDAYFGAQVIARQNILSVRSLS